MHDAPADESTDPVAGEGPFSATATLREASLRELIHAGVVTGFVARGDEGGFVLEAALGHDPVRLGILGNSRGGSRVFASLGTVAVLLKKFGFDRFVVDAKNYVPGRVRAPRPDRSEAMKSSGTKANKAPIKKPQRKPRANAVR